MKWIKTIMLIFLFTGIANAQIDDFYGEGSWDMYFTHNSLSYKFLNDSVANEVNSLHSQERLNPSFWTIGFRVRRDNEKFHWQYRHEFTEYLVGYAIHFVSGGNLNKDYNNLSDNGLLGGVVLGHFKGAWNVVDGYNTKWALGFDAGDFIKDGYAHPSKHLVGIGMHTLFEQKLHDKLAIRGDYSIGITNNIHRDAKEQTDWLPVYHRATLELITDFEMYLGLEYMDILDHIAMHKQRRIDFKIGLRI